MSDQQNQGFGKFVPGFDFLQNLAKGATQALPQMPNISSWIAPTLSVEELEKRISELKAVHFWLDQNSKALGATIQALEVQKMTLATLQGMNFNMADLGNALKLGAADTVMNGMQKMGEKAAEAAGAMAGAATGMASAAKGKRKPAKEDAVKTGATGIVDPLQWWGALTQQFQQIAATAMKEAATATAVDTARNMATGVAKDALKTAGAATRAAAGGAARASRKKPARKAAAKKAA